MRLGAFRRYSPASCPNVDVLCVQERDGGKKRGSDPLDTSQADGLAAALGMNIRVSDSPTTVHTAIAWRPGLQVLNELTLDREIAPFSHHGQSLVQLKGDEWPHPITFASAPLSPFSATLAAIKAQYLMAHLDMWGPEDQVVVAGDVNGPADGDSDPRGRSYQPGTWPRGPAHNPARPWPTSMLRTRCATASWWTPRLRSPIEPPPSWPHEVHGGH